MMAVFFGKFSKHFPDQINQGFYRTNRPEMFGELQPHDFVFAIGLGKIQLWKAIQYTDLEDGKHMDFEIIHSDLGINTSKFVLFRYFIINTDLTIFTIRQSQKAFFKIKLQSIEESDLVNKNLYHDDNNYQKIHVVENKEDIPEDLKEHDIFIYHENGLKFFNSSFVDPQIKTVLLIIHNK